MKQKVIMIKTDQDVLKRIAENKDIKELPVIK